MGITPGKRVGTKRRDMRWEAPDKEIWDSRFEYEVFRAYRAAGINIRRCTEEDSLRFTRRVTNGLCEGCASRDVVTEHSYRPDFFVSADKANGGGEKDSGVSAAGHYLEVKGYLRADRRSLLRALRKARPDVDLRFIIQRDARISATRSLSKWIGDFLKCPAVVFDGKAPGWD